MEENPKPKTQNLAGNQTKKDFMTKLCLQLHRNAQKQKDFYFSIITQKSSQIVKKKRNKSKTSQSVTLFRYFFPNKFVVSFVPIYSHYSHQTELPKLIFVAYKRKLFFFFVCCCF